MADFNKPKHTNQNRKKGNIMKSMHDRIRESKQKEGGFTLIELLIVIVILGILAAVVIFASAGFKNKGAAESCKTTLSSVKTAAEAFHVDNDNALFPSGWSGTNPITPTYFEGNGVTANNTSGTTWNVTGKGWDFNMTFGATAAAATGSPTAPTYANGTLTGVVLNSVCRTA